MQKLCFSGLACLIVAACGTTHLTTRPDGAGPYAFPSDNTVVRVGQTYAMPMLQFKMNVTRTLAQCVNDQGASDIKFNFKVTAEPHYIAGERFTLDYSSISSWSKSGKIQTETYDNGVLKSLNGSAQSQTAAIIGDVVASGISIARLAMGVPAAPPVEHAQPPPGAPAGPAAPPNYVCSAEAMSLLDAQEKSTQILKQRTKTLKQSTDQIAQLSRLLALKVLDKPGKKTLADLLIKQDGLQDALTKATDDAETVSSRLRAVEEVLWPRVAAELDGALKPGPASGNALLDLFEEFKPRADANGPASVVRGPGSLLADLRHGLLVQVKLQPAIKPVPNLCSSQETCAKSNHTDLVADSDLGLYYRSAEPAQLLMCHGVNPEDCDVQAGTGVIISTPVMAPQVGALRMLPFSNGPFQNNALSVAFAADGTITSLTYEEKEARGKALSGAISSAAGAAVDFRDQIKAAKDQEKADANADADAAAKKELDDLDHQISLLQKQQSLKELQTPDASEADTAETAKINAHVAYLEALKKQKEAEAALAAAGGS